jgi:hypothetical protein
VSAGSAIVIPIQFTTPIHSGPTSSTIRVKAREANGKTFYTEVTLGGNIAADYSFDPAYLDFGRTLKTDSPTRSVHIYHQTQGIELIAITNVPSWASARISKSASNITEIGFTILPERMSQSGMHEAQVKLSFNSRWVPSVTLPIRCQVAAPIEIIPSRIVLSDAEPERRDDARFSIVSVEPTRVIGARIKLLNGKTFAPKWNTDSACTTNHKVVVEQSMISEANRIEFEIATLGTGTAKEEAKQVSVEVKRLRKAIRNEETQNSNK